VADDKQPVVVRALAALDKRPWFPAQAGRLL